MSVPFVAVESFFDSALAAKIWPESLMANTLFSEQLMQRKKLNERLEAVMHSLPRPDMSLETAIKQGYATEEQVTMLYESLSDLLSDDDYRRLILYLPFEFLPNSTWRPFREELRQAAVQFQQKYMKAWRRMLCMHDVRANFIDGDVLETEKRIGDLPRVVKAAHLIPKLIAKGLLRIEDAAKLMRESNDPVLRESIADALSVLASPEFLGAKTTEAAMAPSRIWETLDVELLRIDTENFGDVTKNREEWLRKKKKHEAIDAAARGISGAIVHGNLTRETVEDFLACEATPTSSLASVEGIRIAVEYVALSDQDKAHALYERYLRILLMLWETSDSDLKEGLSKAVRRLHHLGIVGDKELADLGIAIPKLEGPFSENLAFMKEASDIRKMVASIKTNPELSRLIYPVALIFGSCLHGYGSQNADIDIGIFVRPETSFSSRIRLQELLKKTFSHEKILGDEIKEFWLEEKEGNLFVHDFAESDASLCPSYWTHVLFGAVWEGDENAISKLREKLLIPYLYDTGKIIEGRDAHSVYVEDIEQATLQYRLMHKGYERFFPPCGGTRMPHADRIDGKSMFWDSGYRQLATRLYASRVFLPKIPDPSKETKTVSES